MAHILIGFAEALPAPEIVFSLRAAGHQVSAFARRGDIALRHLKLKALHVTPAPEDDAAAAQDALRQVMAGPEAPDYVLPLDDAGLWLCSTSLGADPRNAGAVGAQAEVALNKITQTELAQAAGLAVPATSVIRAPEDLHADIPTPSIAKPALALEVRNNRLSKGDAEYLATPAATEELRARLTPDMSPMLVQPLVAGQGVGVFGFVGAQGVVAWSGHKRLRMMNPHGSGSSACQSLAPSAALRAQITDFLQAAGWRGPFMVELLRDADGVDWFMELNGRMWGSMALARRQGLEYPSWAVAQAMNPDFTPEAPPPPSQPVTVRHLGRDLVHLLFVLRGPKSAFHKTHWPRFGASLRAVLTPARRRSFYNYDPAAPGYMWRDAWATLVWQIRR